MDKFKNFEKKLSPSYFQQKLMKKMEKKLAFSEKQDFEEWRRKLGKKFKELIGPIYKDNGKAEYKVLKEEEKNGYTLQKIIFPTTSDSINVAYL